MTVPVLASQFAGADIESGREFRIMAPHVLAALLVAAGLGVQWYALGPALAHLVLLPFLQTTYFNLHDGRFSRVREAVAFSEAIDGRLRFDAEAASGWDNTILMHVDALQPAVVGLPPGIGITFTLDWEEQPRRLKSRYL